MMKNIFYLAVLLIGAFTLASCASSSGSRSGGNNENRAANLSENEQVVQTPTAPPTPPPASPLEKELYYIKGSNFRQVLAFSRKDGGKLSGEDVDFFKQYAPSEQINQRLKSGDDKYIIAGTNFAFQPEQLAALQKRFTVEDFTEKYGRPRNAANANAENSNGNNSSNNSPTPAKTN